MQLQHAIKGVFAQLSGTLEQLSPQQYAEPRSNLFNNSIGQHVRHIIELFQGLENGYGPGIVNYENRKRDRLIETDKTLALRWLAAIYAGIDKPDKSLRLEAHYDELSAGPLVINTNYYREVAYNLEHTIHHMALIRIGLKEISTVTVPDDFGVAAATIKYRNQCAQ